MSTTPASTVDGFLKAWPEFAPGGPVDRLRRHEFGRLDADGHVYLDYTAAGLPAASQIRRHADRLLVRVLGNPHSGSPTSRRATDVVDRARRRSATSGSRVTGFRPCWPREEAPVARRTRLKITPSSGNVFRDLGYSPEEAEHLLIRSDLMIAVQKAVERRALTQAAAAKILGVTQPRVSDLLRGRIDLFSTDALIDMLARLGIRVRVVLSRRVAA
jgi:predicted XRE-type DNA-binding protein